MQFHRLTLKFRCELLDFGKFTLLCRFISLSQLLKQLIDISRCLSHCPFKSVFSEILMPEQLRNQASGIGNLTHDLHVGVLSLGVATII